MATLNDARAIAISMPEVVETSGNTLGWAKGENQAFAWERPFSKADLKKLGEHVPGGTILAIRVESLLVKDAMLEDETQNYLFTIPHFEGYPAVLVCLEDISFEQLEVLLLEAWQSSNSKSKKSKAKSKRSEQR
jgi:hypothetical protein